MYYSYTITPFTFILYLRCVITSPSYVLLPSCFSSQCTLTWILYFCSEIDKMIHWYLSIMGTLRCKWSTSAYICMWCNLLEYLLWVRFISLKSVSQETVIIYKCIMSSQAYERRRISFPIIKRWLKRCLYVLWMHLVRIRKDCLHLTLAGVVVNDHV